jgi:glycosyltransferase involved in cell wall biosynthesis
MLFKVDNLTSQPIIEVLLATYNGERFLREQIDSIIAQDYENIRVIARDDGSIDSTVSILSEYAQRFPDRFRIVLTGPSTRSAKNNFLFLMRESTARYICFSDQDDVWLPDKVRKSKQAMDELESQWGETVPMLIFTDLQVVDEFLNTLHRSYWDLEKIAPGRINQLPSLLGRNVVTGCTAMLNRALVKLSLRMPNDASMHDCWVGLLASAVGKAQFINEQTVLYRQHDLNVIGANHRDSSLRESAQRFFRKDARRVQWKIGQREAEAFLSEHVSELSKENREVLQKFLYCGEANRLLRIITFIRYGFCGPWSAKDIAMMLDI